MCRIGRRRPATRRKTFTIWTLDPKDRPVVDAITLAACGIDPEEEAPGGSKPGKPS